MAVTLNIILMMVKCFDEIVKRAKTLCVAVWVLKQIFVKNLKYLIKMYHLSITIRPKNINFHV